MSTEKDSLIPVLRATRVIKRDGTLLMRSLVQDGDFLLSENVLYLDRFGTPFHITSIASVSKGFHVLFREVTCRAEAEYLVGEEFVIPKSCIPVDGVDGLQGKDVYFNNKKIGVISAWQQTPVYPILVVTNGEDEWRIPVTDSFISIENGRVVLLNGAPLEN
ncbi:hypothetical protein KAH37_09990 [bacterium]|nr:hypothetical protein [bacterium]